MKISRVPKLEEHRPKLYKISEVVH